MKLWCAALLSLIVGSVAAQPVPPATSPKLVIQGGNGDQFKPALGQYRLPNLEERLRKKVLSTNNEKLMKRIDLDQSDSKNVSELERTVRARLTIIQLAEVAKSPAVSETLQRANITIESLRKEALESLRPELEVQKLKEILGTTRSGAISLKDSVLITRAEPIADDNLLPGQHAASTPPEAIWRSGLTFAVLIARNDSHPLFGHCSGTLIGAREVITAAHCLLDEHLGAMLNKKLLTVFLPFQKGTDTVSTPAGGLNHGMKGIHVTDVTWLGTDIKEDFPTTLNGFTPIISDGKDLALLELDAKEMAALPSVPISARLYNGQDPSAPISMVGYGISDKQQRGSMTLSVGVRNELPVGIETQEERLIYAQNLTNSLGGICGGDSGGGLFIGRMNGIAKSPALLGVVSALMSTEGSEDATVCLASEQSHASLLTHRNRKYVCGRVPEACSDAPGI